jgi:hypothetical protein
LDKQTAGWQSEVEQVQSGRGSTFDSLDDLLGFLRRQVAPKETGQLADG